MKLEEYLEGISENNQFRIALELMKRALPIWDLYADQHKLSYRDLESGHSQHIDRHLPEKTINAVEDYLSLSSREKIANKENQIRELSKQFDDPIVALEDSDWEVPDEIENLFFSVYQLTESIINKEQNEGHKTLITQAADVLIKHKLMTFHEIIQLCRDINSEKKQV